MKFDIRPLARSERLAAINLVTRAMRDNPLHIAALGTSIGRRTRVLHRLFSVLLGDETREALGAFQGDRLIGVAAHAPAGACLPSGRQWQRFVPVALAASWRLPWLLAWFRACQRADPKIADAHLGPLAVGPAAQGRGVGTARMRRYLDSMEAELPSFLETDGVGNATCYERLGFKTIRRRRVLGVLNWFMIRTTK